MVIECAFGRLKARFAILKRPLDSNIKEVAHVIYACFVLHNYCEFNQESIAEERVRLAINYDNRFQPPTVRNRSTTHSNEEEARKIRRTLTMYFSH